MEKKVGRKSKRRIGGNGRKERREVDKERKVTH